MAAQKQDKQEEKVNSKTKCLITATGIFFGIMAAVHAKDNDEDSTLCSARGLTETYLFHASGFNISVTGVPQPKAIVEVFRFDGDGKLTGGGRDCQHQRHHFYSQSTAPGADGTYAVNSNCVRSLAFLTGPTFDFFVSQKSELQMVQTNPNTVFQGVAERVSD
jgi:hypothetical protein